MRNKEIIKLIEQKNGESDLTKYLFFAWSNRVLFLLIFIITFGISLWYFSSRITYTATAKFLVNPWKQELLKTNGLSTPITEEPGKILSLFFSDEVLDFIRTKYFLQKIPAGDSLQEAALKNDIAGRISVTSSDYSMLMLRVKSSDRFECAYIANDIVKTVQELMAKQEVQVFAQRIQMITQLRDSSSQQISASVINSIVGKILEELNRLNAKERYSPELTEIRKQVSILADSIRSQHDQLTRLKLANEVMQKTVGQNTFPSITPVQQAGPDYRNYLWANIRNSLLMALLSIVLLPIFIYLFERYRRDWRALHSTEHRITDKIRNVPAEVAQQS